MSANTEPTDSVVWLTQEAHDKLVDELEYLEGTGREEISAKIASAREEGDLSENAGYHAAREEQGQMEDRIRELERQLGRKTLEAEILREALDKSRLKKPTLLARSPLKGDFR